MFVLHVIPREEEFCKLSSDLKKQPKRAPRRSYIERVNEITKNSRKQDNDIQRIMKVTRELQLESNSIQERLNRTYAVVDETIFRYKFSDICLEPHSIQLSISEYFEFPFILLFPLDIVIPSHGVMM